MNLGPALPLSHVRDRNIGDRLPNTISLMGTARMSGPWGICDNCAVPTLFLASYKVRRRIDRWVVQNVVSGE